MFVGASKANWTALKYPNLCLLNSVTQAHCSLSARNLITLNYFILSVSAIVPARIFEADITHRSLLLTAQFTSITMLKFYRLHKSKHTISLWSWKMNTQVSPQTLQSNKSGQTLYLKSWQHSEDQKPSICVNILLK